LRLACAKRALASVFFLDDPGKSFDPAAWARPGWRAWLRLDVGALSIRAIICLLLGLLFPCSTRNLLAAQMFWAKVNRLNWQYSLQLAVTAE